MDSNREKVEFQLYNVLTYISSPRGKIGIVYGYKHDRFMMEDPSFMVYTPNSLMVGPPGKSSFLPQELLEFDWNFRFPLQNLPQGVSKGTVLNLESCQKITLQFIYVVRPLSPQIQKLLFLAQRKNSLHEK